MSPVLSLSLVVFVSLPSINIAAGSHDVDTTGRLPLKKKSRGLRHKIIKTLGLGFLESDSSGTSSEKREKLFNASSSTMTNPYPPKKTDLKKKLEEDEDVDDENIWG